ncbi:MAG: radical SAM protein [bacterium]
MKLLLIYPDINTIQFPHFQHGLAWISSVLKQAGHQVELLYLSREWEDSELASEALRINPDVIAFSSTTQQFPFTRRYARVLKESMDRFMVIGGIHATIDPDNVMEEVPVDALVRGEGEYPLLELLVALSEDRDYTQIQNVWARTASGEIIRNPLRPPVELSGLPWPDRELFDEDLLMRMNDGQVSVMASRGCPFRCTYCCNTVLADLAGGNAKWVRHRDLAELMDEIDHLHKRFPRLKSLIFWDEVFAVKKSRVHEFCEEYKKRFSTPFQVFLRVETVDREMMGWMKEAGLYSIIVGVESGSERIRKEVMNRNMSNHKIIKVFEWADELGLETWDFNMIGVPGDTEETIRETMELNRIIKPHHVQVSIFYPFPGTPLYEKCKEMGVAKTNESTSFFLNRPLLDLPGLPRQRIYELHQEFQGLANQIEAIKSAAGYADLAARFEDANVETDDPEFVQLYRVRIQGEDRMCILMHPPASAAYHVHVRPKSTLRFGIAMSPDVYDKPGGGVTFEVRIKSRLRKERVVFSEHIDPKSDPSHRGWLDREVDLTMFGGKKVELKLRTITPSGENQYCAAFWSRPCMVSSFGEPVAGNYENRAGAAR